MNVKEGGADKGNVYCSVSEAELRLIKTLLTVRAGSGGAVERLSGGSRMRVGGGLGRAAAEGRTALGAGHCMPQLWPGFYALCFAQRCVAEPPVHVLPALPQFLVPRLLGFDEHFQGEGQP